jgi:hypothetical protein
MLERVLVDGFHRTLERAEQFYQYSWLCHIATCPGVSLAALYVIPSYFKLHLQCHLHTVVFPILHDRTETTSCHHML